MVDVTQTLLTDTQSQALAALIALSRGLPAAVDQHLTDNAGISLVEYTVLGQLAADADQESGMGDVACAINVTAPHLSKVVTRLERRGLIHRHTSPADRRATTITLTNAGRALWERADPIHTAYARDTILADIEEDALPRLTASLRAITRHLDSPDHHAPHHGASDRVTT